jgi:iron complex outermembrane receptor protein
MRLAPQLGQKPRLLQLKDAPPTLIDSIVVNRGTSSVDFGPSLVGGVNTNLKDLDYTTSPDYRAQYDLTTIGRSADESYAAGGIVELSNNRFKISALFSKEDGAGQRFPDGDIANTFHERSVFGLTVGYQTDLSKLTVSVRRHETSPTGNPPFAMDIKLVESDFFTANYRRDIGAATLKLDLGYSDIYHEMSNNLYRPAPASAMRYRETEADAETNSAILALVYPLANAVLDMGVDYNNADMNVTIANPLNANFFINNLADINIERTGVYADVKSQLLSWNYSIGARIDSHESSAGDASTGPAVPQGAQVLANAFNQDDRDWNDKTYDVVTRLWKKYDSLTWRLSIASKNRAPGYIERYAWLPTAASAGLADGNNYVGDLHVDPETANIIELGLDYKSDRVWIKPTAYYQQIDDYIQGISVDSTPDIINSPIEMVSASNGDLTPL